MDRAYRLSDVCVTTYDGHIMHMELTGIFHGPRLKIENAILNAVRPLTTRDIPVKATFKMIPL